MLIKCWNGLFLKFSLSPLLTPTASILFLLTRVSLVVPCARHRLGKMTDPSALLHQLLSSVQQIQASQAQQAQSLQTLQQAQQDLQTHFSQLSLNLSPPYPPPPLPDTISAEALAALLAHPFLEDRDHLFVQVLQVALPALTTDEDQAVLQAAYAELTSRVGDDMSATQPAPEHTAASDPPPTHTYQARSGRRFDTRQPPPYPCRNCRQFHWAAGPDATPCRPRQAQHRGLAARFSERGAHHPASAPQRPHNAGSSL